MLITRSRTKPIRAELLEFVIFPPLIVIY